MVSSEWGMRLWASSYERSSVPCKQSARSCYSPRTTHHSPPPLVYTRAMGALVAARGNWRAFSSYESTSPQRLSGSFPPSESVR